METVGQAREEDEERDEQPSTKETTDAVQPLSQQGALPADIPSANGHPAEGPETTVDAPGYAAPLPTWVPDRQTTLPARPLRAGRSESVPAGATPTAAGAPTPGIASLPAVAPGADLARVRVPWYWPALCFVITFAIYVAWVPHFIKFSSPPTGDQVYYMLDTISMVQDGDLLLNNNYQNEDWRKFYNLAPHPPDFVGMGAPDPLSPMLANATARPPEEQYSFHLPGLAVWMIPAWDIGGIFSLWWPACIVFMGLVGALTALNVFLFAHELTGRAWIAWVVWAAVAFSSPLMSYSFLIFTELPVGLLIIYVFRRLALGWGANGPYRLFLLGLALGNIPWLAWRCAPIAGILGLYALAQWWRYRRARKLATSGQLAEAALAPMRNNGSPGWLALLVAPAVVLGALLLYYNIYLFGRIIPDSSVLEQGRVAIFHYPWQGTEDAKSFVSAMFGLFLDRGFGLLPYAPVYVLSFVGVIAAFRLGGVYKRLLLWMGLIALPYMLVVCSFDNWNGVWCPPARYLTTFVPFMGGLLAISLFALRGSIAYKILYALLTIPGWVLMWVMLSDARLFWPLTQGGVFVKLQEIKDSPIKTDLSLLLPIFSPVDDRTHPVNTAWITLAVLLVVALGYGMMLFQRRLKEDAPKHMRYSAQGGVWAVTLLVVGLGWYFINYDYLKHRTEVAQVNRWTIPMKLDEPYGIAYYDGKIYVSSYARNTNGIVGAFDPKSQVFTLIQPVTGTTTVAFSHVGDIKMGPNGDFYVLNNGDFKNAMWVMKPNGQIVKGLSLEAKTPIATGLNFGPDGNIYIADMLGGRILKFQPTGGTPLGVFGGMTGGFNNPAGVAVTPDGTIYAAEQGFERLQQLAPDGTFIRNINLHCKPAHVTVSGDFLDVTCDKGLIGVNWKKGEVQLVHYASIDQKPNNPTGLTYGPNNHLFVLDGNTLIEYQVTH